MTPPRFRKHLSSASSGGSYDVPDVKFFLFGMGARTKLLYRDGILFDAKSGRELQRWKVRREIIAPSDYSAPHLARRRSFPRLTHAMNN